MNAGLDASIVRSSGSATKSVSYRRVTQESPTIAGSGSGLDLQPRPTTLERSSRTLNRQGHRRDRGDRAGKARL